MNKAIFVLKNYYYHYYFIIAIITINITIIIIIIIISGTLALEVREAEHHR